MVGRAVLVGAGPGDPDLLTVRAVRELGRAEVLLYDALIPAAILAHAHPECERIDVGKRGDGSRGVPQDEIAKLIIERARAGRYVVRLKGGDPFLFARGGEEASALAAAGIPFEIVPGIPSALAVPAYAGIPVTDRRVSSSLAIVTGHRAGDPSVNRVDWEGLARSADTLVVLMGTAWLPEIVQRVLAAGRDPRTAAAVISDGATPEQRVVIAPLADLPEQVRAAGLKAPTVIVIGEVARFGEALRWYESRPLFGRRVLLLRAAGQGDETIAALAREGARVSAVPLLAFEPSGDPARLRERAADWIVFSSANAVRFAAPWLPSPLPRVACIGHATAEAAREQGLPVDLVPEAAEPEGLAEALAGGGSLAGTRVLLPRAAEALETLPRVLERAGARVEAVEVYRNVLPDGAPERLREALAAGVEAVLLTSPSSVERLAEILGPAELAALAGRAVFVCIGQTTLASAREQGLSAAEQAGDPSSEGLVAALVRHYAEESHDAVP